MRARRLSAPAEFYLQHKQTIEEWAALRSTVHGEANEFFCSLRDPLEEAAQGLDGAPRLYANLDGTEPPKLFLYRDEWLSVSRPTVGIGLEWTNKRPEFAKSYSGIWVNNGEQHELASKLGSLIAERTLAQAPELGDRGYRSGRNKWWVFWRLESPTSVNFWEDLDGFAGEIVGSVVDLWDLTWEAVDRAVSEL